MTINFDSHGVFTGVHSDGKDYTIKEWNNKVLEEFK